MSGAGAPSDEQKRAFHDRLNRVTGVTPEPENAGSSGTPGPSRPVRPKKKAPPTMRENLRYPLSFVWAFLIGGLSVVVARLVRATFAEDGGLAGVDPDFAMMMDGGIGLAVGFAVRMLFRLNAKELVLAQGAGIALMIATMHNFVHTAPGLWATAFSQGWVDEVLVTTEPNTLLFRGVTFELPSAGTTMASGDAATTPGEMPRIIEIGTRKVSDR
jgi:hypothetical protein